ncbi:MAG: VWA domain-containing protein [Desulfobacterales bacterium]|nr:VWA domain-containing protein [Desulfobacterales bacterium]
MVPLILRFAQCCRSAGLKVSTSEVLDTVKQLQWIDATDESQFRTVLRANFVKSHREHGRFDRVYDMFFHQSLPPEATNRSSATDNAVKAILEAARKQSSDDEASLIDFLAGDPIAYLESLRDLQDRETAASPAIKSNLGAVAGRLHVMLGINRLRSRITRLLDQPGPAMSPVDRDGVGRRLMSRLDTAYALLTRDPGIDNDGLDERHATPVSNGGLEQRPFSSLSHEEVAQMREVVAKLVRKLRDTVSRRWTGRNRGILDIKTTLRSASRYQGLPVEIHFRKRPPRKTRIVTLCDVSGSVWAAARFMLNMLYSLQDCFSKVRSFVFISSVVEVTDIFNRQDIDAAIDLALNDTDIGRQAQTDYGETFRCFNTDFIHTLNKKTTLIIVGDARSNYMNPRESILEEMRQRCRRLIWLNPEPRAFWGTGDSEMPTYRAHCHELRPCQNLKQLADFVSELVL